MRFITCRLPDGVEDPAILSEDGRQVWPLSWLGLSYETLSEAIPFLTPQVRYGLSLAIAGIPALPVEAVTLESPIPAPAQDVICLGINYMAHSDEAEKYSAAAFATRHEDAIYFSKRVTRAVPDGGPIEAHTDLVTKLDYECELAVVLGRDARDVPAGQTRDYLARVWTALPPWGPASSRQMPLPTTRPGWASAALSTARSGRIPIPPCRSLTSTMSLPSFRRA